MTFWAQKCASSCMEANNNKCTKSHSFYYCHLFLSPPGFNSKHLLSYYGRARFAKNMAVHENHVTRFMGAEISDAN